MFDPCYLIRFDDLCPTMNWSVWEEIEFILTSQDVKPIVAVVPDNQDPELMLDPPRVDFWARVRQWQTRGWTIALHGYQHKYVNRDPGLMGIWPQSEFARLPREEQKAKLCAGLAVFRDQGVTTQTWVAPSHSFDTTTLDLLMKLGIRVISDGFTIRHFVDSRGLIWIPCQLWNRITPKSRGVWTICNHHNLWGKKELEHLRQDVQAYRSKIISLPQLIASSPPTPLHTVERLAAWGILMFKFRMRRIVKRVSRWRTQ